MPFEVPELPYAYDALVPTIDEATMKLHHDKHHQAYVTNLNAAIATTPELADKSAEKLIADLASLPDTIRKAVQNNGGGHVNHTMFWEIMGPGGGGAPTGEIATLISEAFGDFDAFKKAFNEATAKQFGAGWGWVVLKDGKLTILTTANQDSPISHGLFPILGNDVWEHAYYLTYNNRRPDYLAAWWNVINWNAVNARLAKAKTYKA